MHFLHFIKITIICITYFENLCIIIFIISSVKMIEKTKRAKFIFVINGLKWKLLIKS